jgi:two-component system chemotaxis response regulator CheB
MPGGGSIRVLVVDDTILYRKAVSDILEEMDGVEVVATANNGKIALSKIESLHPDLVTLDVEMPEVNGIEVLAEVKARHPEVGVVMLSALTRKGSDLTMRALELGAFDFVTKPETGGIEESRAAVRKDLAPIVKAFFRYRDVSGRLKIKAKAPATAEASSICDARCQVQRMRELGPRQPSEVVAIGVSTGGPKALAEMLPGLGPGLSVPVLIVQHMPPLFTQSLARSLDAKCPFTVKEAVNGEMVVPGTVYIAPGGKQMKVVLGSDATRKIIRVTDDAPENNCKPSADYLFRSVAHHYLGRATGVIMTGMGRDGATGLKLMKRNGSVIIAQDEATSVVFGMPKEAISEGTADIVAPLDGIAREITATLAKPSSGKRPA